jgi:hypothetical protein
MWIQPDPDPKHRLAGGIGNSDSARQLLLDNDRARPSVVETVGDGSGMAASIFVWCWILCKLRGFHITQLFFS